MLGMLPGARYMLPGVRYIGARYVTRCSVYMLPDARYMLPGARHIGTRCVLPGGARYVLSGARHICCQVLGTCYQVLGIYVATC